MKKAVRSIIIFWGIVALFLLCYLIYEREISYRLFGLGDGQALATTWLDSNANGIQDPNEKPFANVFLWYGYNPSSGNIKYHFSTDEQGKWGEFLPGGRCDEVFVFAKPPDGFRATTDLASNACDAKFGFVAKDVLVKQDIIDVERFIQRKILIDWITKIIISLTVIVVGIIGTIWLQKEP